MKICATFFRRREGWPVLLLIFAAAVVAGTQTEKFQNDTFSDFAEGEARGIAITSDGFLKLGPAISKRCTLPVSVVWAVVADGSGRWYVAAGNEGQVFRIAADGKPEVLFKAAELQVQALAFHAGNLYAASGPDGKIYKLDGGGKSTVFFDPKEKYIWALKFDGEGNLFAATGDKGRLYKISPGGKGRVFYDSDETHLRALLLDGRKRLWVGTEGTGLVYRFDKTEGGDATPFVAYDSSYREITAMALSPKDGGVFVAAMGNGKSPSPSFPLSSRPAPTAANSAVPVVPSPSSDSAGAKSSEEPPSSAPSDKPGAGEITRISPDGSTEKWWSQPEDVYSLAFIESGRIWAGTGHKGRLIEITAPRRASVLGQIEAETITALFQDEKGRWLAATSNGGAIWSLDTSAGRKGTFESGVLDARGSARWGILDPRTAAGAAGVRVQTRSGNTSKPDKVWSSWSALDKENRVTSPVAHFIQYRLTIEGGASAAPVVDSVSLYYRVANLAPRVSRVAVLPSNLDLMKTPKVEGALPPVVPGAGGGRSGKVAEAVDEAIAAMTRAAAVQPVKRLGWRAATWQASDANSDDLRFSVLYRPAGSEDWKSLKSELADPFVSWDAATWPDGDYYLKVKASDRSSNSEDEARSDEATSDLFVVDNTAPVIKVDPTGETVPKGHVGLTISDTTSVVDEAEYSLDGAEWRPLPPVSGIYDSRTNTFRVPLGALKTGDHHVVVRASDAANNVATETVRFKQ